MTTKAPGIFSAHAGTNLRFFDRVSEAQDWAERHNSAVLRRDYGDGWTDVAKWNGQDWTYIHRKTSKKRAKKTR